MRRVLHGRQGGVAVASHVTNIRYVDDVVLIAASTTEIQDLVDRVKLESKRSRLFENATKTKVMNVRKNEDPIDNIQITVNIEPDENVSVFAYL